jgi:hypothetical protein
MAVIRRAFFGSLGSCTDLSHARLAPLCHCILLRISALQAIASSWLVFSTSLSPVINLPSQIEKSAMMTLTRSECLECICHLQEHSMQFSVHADAHHHLLRSPTKGQKFWSSALTLQVRHHTIWEERSRRSGTTSNAAHSQQLLASESYRCGEGTSAAGILRSVRHKATLELIRHECFSVWRNGLEIELKSALPVTIRAGSLRAVAL